MPMLFARNRRALSSPPTRWLCALSLLTMMICGIAPAVTAQENFTFDVTYGGMTVVRITGGARETGSAYAVGATIRATGLVALFAPVNFRMNAEGAFGSADLRASAYREEVDTGQRQSTVDMVWRGGMPSIRSQVSGTENPVPPSAARGSVDPLTTIYRLARPRPESELCNWRVSVYDGARLSSMAVGAPSRQGDTITCPATHRRLEGFPADDLARHPAFNFTARFHPVGDLWQLTELTTGTIYGTVRIVRRN